MTSTKLTGLTAITSPSLSDILYLVSSPGSSPLSQKITVQNLLNGYVLHAGAAEFNPADATTYFFGARYYAAPGTGSDHGIYIPRAGTLSAVALEVFTLGTLGSSTTSTISIYYNGGASLTTVSSSVTCNTTLFVATPGVTLTVAVGDRVELRWVTPTWATNPTQVALHASLYIT
jgi:hypothetical protein